MAFRFGLNKEPVLVTAFVAAALVVLVEFGVPITDGQQKAIDALIVTGFALFARSRVASESTLINAGTSVRQVKAVAKSDVAARLIVRGVDKHKVPSAPMDEWTSKD